MDRSFASEVWLAEHAKTKEHRVFKFASNSGAQRSLKREVTLARLLRQELGETAQFVRLLEWNLTTVPYYLEMEYAGPNLTEWADAHGGLRAIPIESRLCLLIDIARIVATTHELGVLHKDLKPANVLVVDRPGGVPQVKVADFGSASLLAPARLAELDITNVGFTRTSDADSELTGTLMYLAPEILAGASPSAASDVYALGILLYQLVFGDFRKPITPGWEADVADPVLREDIASSACGDPERRLRTASELADRLANLDERRASRHAAGGARRWGFVAAAVLLVAAGAGVALLRSPSPVLLRVRTLAILPFENIASDPDSDFLTSALPDEVATALGHVTGVAVRPFEATDSYAHRRIDLQKAAKNFMQERSSRDVSSRQDSSSTSRWEPIPIPTA